MPRAAPTLPVDVHHLLFELEKEEGRVEEEEVERVTPHVCSTTSSFSNIGSGRRRCNSGGKWTGVGERPPHQSVAYGDQLSWLMDGPQLLVARAICGILLPGEVPVTGMEDRNQAG